MKRQYRALLAIFIALIAFSFWTAAQTNLPQIESRIGAHNESHQGNESLIEGKGVLPYFAVTGLLLAVGVITYWVLGQRRAR
jgi:hypothetical protein